MHIFNCKTYSMFYIYTIRAISIAGFLVLFNMRIFQRSTIWPLPVRQISRPVLPSRHSGHRKPRKRKRPLFQCRYRVFRSSTIEHSIEFQPIPCLYSAPITQPITPDLTWLLIIFVSMIIFMLVFFLSPVVIYIWLGIEWYPRWFRLVSTSKWVGSEREIGDRSSRRLALISELRT